MLRALLVALDQWVSNGVEPPPSAVPGDRTGRRSSRCPAGTPDRCRAARGARLAGDSGRHLHRAHHHPLLPRLRAEVRQGRHRVAAAAFARGVPPTRTSCRAWTRTATRSPASACRPSPRRPRTTTGWALRRAEFGENDGCEAAGQYIPFKATHAERTAPAIRVSRSRSDTRPRGIRAGRYEGGARHSKSGGCCFRRT